MRITTFTALRRQRHREGEACHIHACVQNFLGWGPPGGALLTAPAGRWSALNHVDIRSDRALVRLTPVPTADFIARLAAPVPKPRVPK